MDREIGQNLFIEYKQGYEKLVPDSMTICHTRKNVHLLVYTPRLCSDWLNFSNIDQREFSQY